MRLQAFRLQTLAIAAALAVAGCRLDTEPFESNGPSDCQEGQQLCSGVCADVQTDAAHCGACGNACGAGLACVAGECQEPKECGELVACGDQCVEPLTDAEHCGTCGNACDAGQLCELGRCLARTECTVEMTAAETVEDFQVRVVFDTTEAVASGDMLPSCGDLRVLSADGTAAIPHWLESGCGTAETTVWLKMPLLEPESPQTLHLRYGGGVLDTRGDGAAVFAMFDDFRADTEALYTVHQNVEPAGGFVWAPDDGRLYTNDANDDFYLMRNGSAAVGQGYWVEIRARNIDNDGLASAVHTGDGAFYGCVATDEYHPGPGTGTQPEALVKHDDVPGTAGHEAETVAEFGDVASVLRTSAVIGLAYDGDAITCGFNGQAQAPAAVGTLDVVAIGLASYSSQPEPTYDWLRARKFAATEPTVQVSCP